jgi:hypothetical protein
LSNLRCSQLAREWNVSPIGTAASFDALLLVAAPQPWPKDAKELPSLQHGPDAWGEATTRVQLVTGAEANDLTVAEYRADGGPFGGYVSDHLDGTVVLVCCHGRRDVCCGGDGTRLALELERTPSRPFRVLRTSHLGGHRFAPTALVLPQGTMWAFADADFLVGVVTRSIQVEQAMPRYRGCTGLADPAAQVADAGALLLHGWGWLDEPRSVEVEAGQDGVSDVLLRSAAGVYRALVGVRRLVPAPPCGEPAACDAAPTQPEYELLAIRSELTGVSAPG